MPQSPHNVAIREALPSDLEELLRLEAISFDTDRLSRRSFRRWLRQDGTVFLVCPVAPGALSGYVLVILRRGTRLARLYSIAVDPGFRGRGIAQQLILRAEQEARRAGALYMRLEVAEDNAPSIALYRKLGYLPFGRYRDYYAGHGDALRMEKCIRPYASRGDNRVIPWLAQSTDFTCGPASLMMAMAACDPAYTPSVREEIALWRESTTVFMTSGHGGCHPIGLALCAWRRGFEAEVWLNQRSALFLDGVRDPRKKRVVREVHEAFVDEARRSGLAVHYQSIDQDQLGATFSAGANVLILISTYRLDRRRAPHWVVLSGVDESCFYVQDPDEEIDCSGDIANEIRAAIDCQHLPIARDDLAAMRRYGGNRLEATVAVRQSPRRAAARAGAAAATDGRVS